MRSTLLFLTFLALASGAAGPVKAGRPVYAVLEQKDVTITTINEKAKRVLVTLPKGGSLSLAVGPKTWIIKDGDEASFDDLRVGQRLHVRYIPRTSQAVTLEVAPPKAEK
ncbi:MAG: hypothetical protein U0793_30835 [Gemmataceae bacterium]